MNFFIMFLIVFVVILFIIFFKIRRRKKSTLFEGQVSYFPSSERKYEGIVRALLKGEKPVQNINRVGLKESGGEKFSLSFQGKNSEVLADGQATKAVKIGKTNQVRHRANKILNGSILPSLPKDKKKNSNQPSFHSDEPKQNPSLNNGPISVENYFYQIADSDLNEIMKSLDKERYSLIFKKLSSLSFSSKSEFLDGLSQELVMVLDEGYRELKQRISTLRKSGKDMGELGLKLMSLPLKIKVFSSTLFKKDFDVVLRMFTNLDSTLSTYSDAKNN